MRAMRTLTSLLCRRGCCWSGTACSSRSCSRCAAPRWATAIVQIALTGSAYFGGFIAGCLIVPG
jgi:hypothetical protein